MHLPGRGCSLLSVHDAAAVAAASSARVYTRVGQGFAGGDFEAPRFALRHKANRGGSRPVHPAYNPGTRRYDPRRAWAEWPRDIPCGAICSRDVGECGINNEADPKPVIHIVDDDDSMRMALIELLRTIGFDAIGYGSTGEFLLNSLPDQHGCILLDIRLPGPSGLELQAALLRKGVALPIIFLTGHADVSSSVRAMKAGAIDFLEKPVARETLLEALGRALASDRAHRDAAAAARRHQERLDLLTPREQAVFERIISGMLNKQIALELGISLRTVKAHRAQMMQKLGVSTAAELGLIAGKSAESDDR